MNAIEWQYKTYDKLDKSELYAILQARQAVFIVEQDCAYPDIDDMDQDSRHLMAWEAGADGIRTLAGYLRVVPPGNRFAEPSIGRLLTATDARQSGLGKELMRRALRHAEHEFPGTAVRISAQRYLESFYQEFGFETVSAPYDEDGIPHVEMLKA